MNRQRITVDPLTRIEGHARLTIDLDRAGNVADTRLQVISLRGFEQLLVGRPAEEAVRIVTRICGICPWMHHLASVKAVDRCFGVQAPASGRLLRELCLTMAHIGDKVLHFFFLSGPDLLLPDSTRPRDRSLTGLARLRPELARQVADMHRLAHRLLEKFAGRSIHPVAGICGGFSRPMTVRLREELRTGLGRLLEFALAALDLGRPLVLEQVRAEDPAAITTGFLGTVDGDGGLSLYRGTLRLMRSDGTWIEFPASQYRDYLREQAPDWSYGKMVWAACWDEGFSLDPESPAGIFRTNTLALINVCDRITTPRAGEALAEFRQRFGRPAQATGLFHWTRLIELVYCCERALELLEDERIMDPRVCVPARPGQGYGIGQVEAPRGTLIHEYETDDNGCITRANIIVGTGHNLAAMNLGVRKAAARLIRNGNCTRETMHRIERAVRAYDP